eukprot:scaffold1954_cov63-Phaeocystis_antarctica.AAC.3
MQSVKISDEAATAPSATGAHVRATNSVSTTPRNGSISVLSSAGPAMLMISRSSAFLSARAAACASTASSSASGGGPSAVDEHKGWRVRAACGQARTSSGGAALWLVLLRRLDEGRALRSRPEAGRAAASKSSAAARRMWICGRAPAAPRRART